MPFPIGYAEQCGDIENLIALARHQLDCVHHYIRSAPPAGLELAEYFYRGSACVFASVPPCVSERFQRDLVEVLRMLGCADASDCARKAQRYTSVPMIEHSSGRIGKPTFPTVQAASEAE